MTAAGLARYVHNVTPEQIEKIKVIDQRSDEWLNARKFRLTASNFGAAAGHCKHNPPMGLVAHAVARVPGKRGRDTGQRTSSKRLTPTRRTACWRR